VENGGEIRSVCSTYMNYIDFHNFFLFYYSLHFMTLLRASHGRGCSRRVCSGSTVGPNEAHGSRT